MAAQRALECVAGQDGARAREELLEVGGGVDTVVVTAVVAFGEEGRHRAKGRRYRRSADGESEVVEDLFGDLRSFDDGEKLHAVAAARAGKRVDPE